MPTSQVNHYSISLNSVAGHLLDVCLSIPKPDAAGQVLALPAWIPGSYMIRDFAKNIVRLQAFDQSGTPLVINKLDKQTWQLPKVEGPVQVQYQVFAFDFSVRSAYVCDEYVFFNGTSVFLEVVGQGDSPCSVNIPKPDMPQSHSWRLATTLPLDGDTSHGEFGDYQAENYAELVDHPVLYGDIDTHPFKVRDVEFELVFSGGHHADTARITSDLAKICEHHFALFGDDLPIQRYLFLTLLSDNSFGGLEHLSSTALMFSRGDLPNKTQADSTPDGYRTFLGLCSHELFHTWHVKRIKPAALSNSSLSTEQYTEQLWIYEGFTSFYDDISLCRSGVITPESYLELAGQNLTRLLRNQGRLKQTVTESSFDAWTRFYQQDASAINNIVSYYNKGAVVAMCLDLLLREKSQGRCSLDDVMRSLWREYGKTGKGTEVNVIQRIVSEELKLNLSDFFDLALYSTDELPVESTLASVGLTYKTRSRQSHNDKGGKAAEQTVQKAFGAAYTSVQTGVKISVVSEGTPAYDAGLQVGDQLVAINQWQVDQSSLQNKLDACEGDKVTLTLLRDKKLKSFDMALLDAPMDTVFLEVTEDELAKPWLSGL